MLNIKKTDLNHKHYQKVFPWYLEVTFRITSKGSFVDIFLPKAGKFGNKIQSNLKKKQGAMTLLNHSVL